MARNTRLEDYQEKRDFSKTPEPKGTIGKHAGPASIFVIQKHDARQLHYDFRLEVDGVLKSWAVPKGPSTNPKDKRLAVQTEDHPLAYADFEGTIPEGEYGGGTVMVWDAGTYRNMMGEKDEPWTMNESLEKGHVEVWLEGQKLRGGYALVRTAPRGGKANWLLVKMKDEEADGRRNPTSTENKSVLTQRMMKQIADGKAP